MQYRLLGNVNIGNWDTRIPFEYDGELNLNPTNRSRQ